MSKKLQKLERDGKIAVLYSPDYGAGWSTWNKDHAQELIFDQEVIEQVLAGDLIAAVAIAEKKYPDMYFGGGNNLEVAWLTKGEKFWMGDDLCFTA